CRRMVRKVMDYFKSRAAYDGDVMMPHSHAGKTFPRAQLFTQRAFVTVKHFMHIQTSSGIVLLVAAAIALIWANSPLAHSYHDLWHTPLAITLGNLSFS